MDEIVKCYGFRIVHRMPTSPLQLGSGCSKYIRYQNLEDLDLTHFVGDDGLVRLLGFLEESSQEWPYEQATLKQIIKQYGDKAT